MPQSSRIQTVLLHTLLTVGSLIISPPLANSEENVVPFVAGFDRFARHGSIDAATAGSLLISELSCTACHASDAEIQQPKRGPILDGVADRINKAWLQKFLTAPATAKPGTTMPDVLAGVPADEKRETVAALTAFLATLHKPFPEIKATGLNPVPLEFWDRGNSDLGKELYHTTGCVACHAPDPEYDVPAIAPSPIDQLLEQLEPEEIAEMGLESAARRVESIPHPDFPEKYTQKGLTFFLLNPESVRTSGRMPNFSFGAVDAADLAAYLMRSKVPPESSSAEFAATDGDVKKGQQLFNKLGCASCHTVAVANVVAKTNAGSTPAATAKTLASLNFTHAPSCIGAPQRGLPHFAIDDAQRAALQVAINPDSSTKITLSDQLRAKMLQLNCYACHDRDKSGGVGRFRRPYFETVGNVDIGDEGRLPPSLTSVGRKLTTPWLKNVFAGKAVIRPHMHIRMPVFPAELTKNLPAEFAAVDFANTESGTADQFQTQPSDEDVFGSLQGLDNDGRALMDAGCVQCHIFKGEVLPGTVGVDLAGIAGRVYPQWFHDFLHNPAALKERTRMPTFFPNGNSQNKDILDGDTEKQIAAMWAYLKDIDKLPIPEKIIAARNQDYELVPKDRAIVLRTFMPEAGTHAIAVGFPEDVHFAFDSENIRLAEGWKGRFLDAQGTWFVRFTPPADPLGEQLATFPESVPFALLVDAKQTWPADAGAAGYRFRGYRLNKAGVPTFLYQFGNYDVEDTIQPADGQSLMRRFRLKQRSPNSQEQRSLLLRGHQGLELKPVTPQTYVNETGLQITVSKGIGNSGELRRNGPKTESIIPLPNNSDLEIEVRYSW